MSAKLVEEDRRVKEAEKEKEREKGQGERSSASPGSLKMSMWIREEPLSASALGACYSQSEKGEGAEIDAVPLMSQ